MKTKWKKNFFTLFVGQQLSFFTSMIAQYALIWYLTDRSKSPTLLAMYMLIAFIPGIIIGPLVGPLIDRMNKKILLLSGDWIVALAAIILAIYGQGGPLPFWLLGVAMFIRSFAGAIQTPTTQSIIPTLVPETFVPKVSGLNGAFNSASMIITPAIGAFFYSLLPISQIMLVDVAGAIIATITVLMTQIPSFEHLDNPNSYLHELVAGFKLVRHHKGIFNFLIITTLIGMFAWPAFSLYPLITTTYFHGSISDASIVEVFWSIGSLLGGLLIGLFATTKRRLTIGVMWYYLAGIAFTLMGFLPDNRHGLWLFIALQLPGGIGFMAANGLFMSIVQQAFPAKQTGRIMGITQAMVSMASPIGLIFAAPLAETIGIPPLLIIAGVSIFIGNIASMLLPEVRELDHMVVMTDATDDKIDND
ncbi:MFS transporter [Lactococcus laudensis]|uniref:MFS transporter n=1 Tax=Pseudolactococcus laudensis TaxID=1494461 RepID=A0A7V8SIS7_9LACT|nr:MFS transporter [Lactococcus laudensis]MBA0015629.1 MFS transporter [Lactococcus laudensis]MBW9280636.1 MFS transporter [Lactococcus laudensis]